LGSPDRWTLNKTQIVSPIFLSNFSAQNFDSLEFTLAFEFPKLRLASIRGDDSVTARVQGDSGTWRVTWRKKSGSQGYGWIKAAEAVLSVQTFSGETPVALREAQANGNPQDSLPPAVFRVRAGTPSGGFPAGDLNRDTTVTTADAVSGFQSYAVSSSDPPEYEISQRSPVCAHDFALLYRHAIGLMPSLPIAPDPAPVRGDAEIQIDNPENLGNSLFRYRIAADKVQGALSAELCLNLNGTVIEAVQQISGTGRESLIYGRLYANNLYNLFAAYLDSLPVFESQLFTVVAKHRAGQNSGGLSLYSAFLNEGRIQGAGFPTAQNPRGNPTPFFPHGDGVHAAPVPMRALPRLCPGSARSKPCYTGTGRLLRILR
jgi:hypothetical protein